MSEITLLNINTLFAANSQKQELSALHARRHFPDQWLRLYFMLCEFYQQTFI